MAKLNVTYCMVCEDVRPEMHGKYSILGFFGLLPNVNIKLQEMGKALDRLVFLMNVEGDPGRYKFKFAVFGPDTKSVFPEILLEEMEILADPNKQAMAAINLAGLVFKEGGTYIVQLSHRNKVFYKASFAVEVGEPDLF